MEKKDFIGMFDVLKGILMLLVVFAHHLHMMDVLSGSASVHHAAEELLRYQAVPMAMFFMITGYDFHPARKIKTYVRRQAKFLLLPYLLTVLAAAAVRLLAGLFLEGFVYQRATVIIAGGLYGCTRNTELFGISATSVIALWFLPTLFFGGLIYQLLWKLKNQKLRIFLVWGLTVAAVSFPDVDRIQVPWFLVQSCASLGFLETGRILKKHKYLYRKLSPVFAAAATGLFCFGALFSASNVGDNIWRYWMLDYATCVGFSVVLLRLYIKSGIAEARHTAVLEFFGRYSLYVLCLHGFEMLAFPWYDLGDLRGLGVPAMVGWTVLLYLARLLFIAGGCIVISRLSSRRRK